MEGQKINYLGKQVHVYSLGTDAFLFEEERELKKKVARLSDLRSLRRKKNSISKKILEFKEELQTVTNEAEKKQLNKKIESRQRQLDYYEWLREIFHDVTDINYKKETEKINDKLDFYKKEFQKMVDANDKIRVLNNSSLNPKAIISVFESTFTRKLQMDTESVEPSNDIFIVEVYNNKVFKDLLDKGFYFNNELYIYYASSSGQIRDKKTMWIKESKWKDLEMSLMCGLKEKDINAKGGMSINKFLSYKALTTSASAQWTDFNEWLEKSIVVDDVKVILNRTVDYVDRNTYEIERKENYPIELEITDGAGMCLPIVSESLFGEGKYKNFQFRAPFMKGLLSCMPFDKMLKGKESLIIKDAWGDEHDIIKEKISIIFFKSQMKMKKYFDSWEHYKKNFTDYNCEAAIMNPEEDIIQNAKLNYQYLQSLIDMEDSEIDKLVKSTNEDIVNIGSDLNTMLRVLSADESNTNKNYLQQAIEIFPELLHDEHVKQTIKLVKSSLVKEGRAGKLNIDGKFTYVLPDWYYVMNRIFFNKEKALLEDGQIYCELYQEGKVNCLRSPSLSFEHVIHENVKTDEMKNWYLTKGAYVSPFSMMSKILMMDYDGDRIMITPSKCLIEAVERNQKLLDVVPLEYEMGVADPQLINSDNIFESLKIAFEAGEGIGIISNNISKCWNVEKDKFDYSTIKKLTSYNNFLIDAAKTLDLPKPPPDLQEKWDELNKEKLPYFFKFAKSKKTKTVLPQNKSTVNKIGKSISKKNIYFRNVVNKFDYRMLLSKCIKDTEYYFDKETDQVIIDTYTYLDQNKKKFMNNDETEDSDRKSQKKKQWVYKYIRKKLLEIKPDPYKVADVLIRYLYMDKDSPFKTTLWEVFGRLILQNLKHNLKEGLICEDCKCRFRKVKNKKARCEDCQKKKEREDARLRKQKERAKKKVS